MTERTFRQSDIGNYLWCRRNFMWAVHRRLTPIWEPERYGYPPRTSSLGSLVHASINAMDHGLDWKAAAHDLAMIMAAPESGELSPDWHNLLDYNRVMVTGYQQWLEEYGADIGLVTLQQEDRLWVDLGEIAGDHVTLTGAPDRVRRDELTGGLIVDDIKTIGGSSIESVQTHNRQLMTYAIMLLILTGEAAEALTTTQLVKSKRTKDQPLTKIYGRSRMVTTPEMYGVHYEELIETIRGMVELSQRIEAGELSAAVQNPGRDCDWRCSVKELCIAHNYGGHVEHMIRMGYRTAEVTENV